MAMSDMPNPSPRVPNAAASPRRWRELGLLLGLILLVLAGLIGLALATGWEETVAALASISFVEIGVLLALSLANYVLRGLRWHLFATRLGLPVTVLQSMRHFIGGFAMSVTPGRVGELVRMRWIYRETDWAFERTAPLVLVDRAADLAAMALLLAAALAFSASGYAGAVPVVILALGSSIIVTRPALMRGAANVGHLLTRRALPRLFARIRRAARSLSAFKGAFLLTLAGTTGLIGWLAEGYALFLLLDWFGAGIGFWTAVGIFIFATLAGGLTGAPGGLGGAEAAMVALLILEGVPPEMAVPATLVIRVTTLWFAILIGLIVFPLAESASKKAKDALEIG